MRVIIPAAGRATRFGGVLKELLPVPGPAGTPLAAAVTRAFTALAATSVVVITTPEKIDAHARALASYAIDITYRVQSPTQPELWGAIVSELQYNPCDGGLIMPDTIWSGRPMFPNDGPLSVGVFGTREPHRFSVIHSGGIVTKSSDLPTGSYSAWGCITWRKDVAEHWRNRTYDHYDHAFEDAMRSFGYKLWYMSEYHDIGSLETYMGFLASYYRVRQAKVVTE